MKISKLLTIFGKGKTVSKSHIRNLLEMARADGKVDDLENELLFMLAERYEVSPAIINRMSTNEYEVVLDLPDNEREKFDQFFDLVQMMMADNFMHEDEINLCYFFAVRYGYKKDRIENLVQEAVVTIREGGDSESAWDKVKLLLG
jgi:uncharacterized tellurite resistance protein B-like protein